MKQDDTQLAPWGNPAGAADTVLPSAGLGQRIKRQRKSLGMTLSQLSDKSGVSIATISKIENGHINGGFDTVYKVARGLGVLVNDLIDGGNAAQRVMVVQKKTPDPRHPTEYYDYYPQAMRIGGALNPYLMTIKTKDVPPKVDWSNHAGEEFVHVISGAIDLHHDGSPTQRLNQGDSACFDCGPAHCFVCVSDAPAVIVTVSTRGIAAQSPRARSVTSGNSG
ncbi:MAG: XRE family transcriptional regulator [Paracoccaceae bacterium]